MRSTTLNYGKVKTVSNLINDLGLANTVTTTQKNRLLDCEYVRSN